MKILKPTFFLAVGFLLMYLAFKDQNIYELIDRLKSVEIKWVIFSMCFGALAIGQDLRLVLVFLEIHQK